MPSLHAPALNRLLMKLPYVDMARCQAVMGSWDLDDHTFTHSLKHGHQTANIVPPLFSLSLAPMGIKLMRYRYNAVEDDMLTAQQRTHIPHQFLHQPSCHFPILSFVPRDWPLNYSTYYIKARLAQFFCQTRPGGKSFLLTQSNLRLST